MKIPAGPEGSFTSLIADGKPSRSVRRLPSGSIIEIRPECNAMLPVSETSKLPWFVSAEPSGWRRPVVTSEHWAEAVAVSENNKSENMVEKLNHLSIFLYMGVSLSDKWFETKTPLSTNARATFEIRQVSETFPALKAAS